MILIIDEKHDTTSAIQNMFSIHGFTVDSVNSIQEALTAVLKKRYLVIIVDLQMVQLSEAEVLEALRLYNHLNDIPTIFLVTDQQGYQHQYEDFNDEKIEYVSKPINEDILLLKVKALRKLREVNLKLIETEQKLQHEIEVKEQAKLELQNRIHYLRTILETIPQIAFKADGDGRITFVNNHWYQYSSSIDQFPEQINDTKDIITKWKECIALKIPLDYEVQIKHLETGLFRHHLLRIEPIKENDEVKKWVGTFTDIEEQKQVENKKEEFLSIASHELKTPLTSIKGYVQLLSRLLKSTDNEVVLTCVNNVRNQVSKLEWLVSDVLDAFKINNGKLKMNFGIFNLKDLINNAIATIENTNQNNGIEIVRVDDVLDLELEGDFLRMEQVLIKVLLNAIKYSPGREKVFIRTRLQDNEVLIEVEDYGIGIPSERQKFIFSKFYKVEDSVIGFHGLGIGLYISSEIIKQHRGTYGLKSDLGRGTKVYFTLPLS